MGHLIRPMARLFALLILVLALAGGVVGRARAALPTAAAHDVVVLRADTGVHAAFLARPAAGRGAHYLPLGLTAPGGRILYAAAPRADGNTLVRAIDIAGGRTLRSLLIKGQFSTRSGDYSPAEFVQIPPPGLPGTHRVGASLTTAPVSMPAGTRAASSAHGGYPADGSQMLSALSFNGRWLALREDDVYTNGGPTRVVVIDTVAMREVMDRELDGLYGLDAISADGAILYLIQPMPNVYLAYEVRSYEVRRGILDTAVVIAPGERPGSMNGEAWTRSWSPDGAWLYTLYVQSNGHTFVHALHLAARDTRCLDLPSISGNAGAMSFFTLSVAPAGGALYAVNPELGRAVRIALPSGKATMVGLGMHAGSPQRTQDAAAIAAATQRVPGTVFVATNHGVWAVDTHTSRVRAVYLADQSIGSVALSADGGRLYALESGRNLLLALDPSSGRVLGAMQAGPAAWAIERVTLN